MMKRSARKPVKILSLSPGMNPSSAETPKNQKRRRWILAATWLFVLTVALLLTLQITGTAYWWRREIPVATKEARPSGHGPFSYVAANVAADWLSQTDRFRSPVRVMEDGRPLTQANAPHADIGRLGGGRFSFWHGTLYFSASDNSDPRANGRTYVLLIPKRIGPGWVVLGWGMVIIFGRGMARVMGRSLVRRCQAVLGFAAKAFTAIASISPKTLLVVSGAVITIAFLLPRLPWFIDYHLPAIQLDTASYFWPVQQMFSGQWPAFDVRTPGYPLFLFFALRLWPRLMFIVVLQNVLTLASVLFLTWAASKAFGRLAIWVALAMVAHVTQPLLSGQDFALVTESLYSSCLLFCLGFFVLALWARKSRYFLIYSFLSGFAVWIRPSGLFLLGCLGLVLIYLLANGSSRKTIFSLAIPMPAMILALMIYNFAVAGFFSITRISTGLLYGITAAYWEPDAAFSEEMNKSIREFRARIPEADRVLLFTSWSPAKLNPIFAKFAKDALFSYPKRIVGKTPYLGLAPRARSAIAKRVGLKAIGAHPLMAVKFFWTMFAVFLTDHASWTTYFYNDISWMADQMYLGGTARDPFVGREYTSPPRIPAIHLEGEGEGRHFVAEKTKLARIYFTVGGILKTVYDSGFWLAVFIFVWLVSLGMTLGSRFRHGGAFFVFTVGSWLMGSATLVALTAYMNNRYPSPTKFIGILTAVLGPLLRKKEIAAIK